MGRIASEDGAPVNSHITLRSLPAENLRRKPLRTVALIIVVMLLSVALFGGSLLSINLGNGMRSMEERLGADLMVVPQNLSLIHI